MHASHAQPPSSDVDNASIPALWAFASRALNCDCFISKLRRLDQGPFNLIIAVIVLLHPYLNLVDVPSAHPPVGYLTYFRLRKPMLDCPTESTDAIVISILQTRCINLASSLTSYNSSLPKWFMVAMGWHHSLLE